MSAFVNLVEEMKKAYGRSIVNFSEIKSEIPTMKRAYLQINFAKFTDLVQFYGGSSPCLSAVVSSFFTRIMEFYRSSCVCCKEMREWVYYFPHLLQRIAESVPLSLRILHRIAEMGTAKVASASMRIAKRIARSGVCSRREAEELIRNGRVSLNGVIVTSPALNVTDQDEVCVDMRRLSPIQRTRVIVANKRAGELVTTKDERGTLL